MKSERAAVPRTCLGRYELLAAIGHGGMSDVYLALVRGVADVIKLLVVKQLRPGIAGYAATVRMFIDEARLAARLNHPNVVQTYEVGNDGDAHFIAMEFLDGQPLHRLVQAFQGSDEGFPRWAHLRVLVDMLTGLHYAHDLTDYDGTPLAVVHRDVSPQNVFVTYMGQVKLVDFGIAKALDSVVETDVGSLKGKLAYMSPQQARGEPVDRRTDIFSVGVMLWEAIHRRRLWDGVSDAMIAHNLTTERLPDFDETSLPPELVRIGRKAMHTDPERRYQTAREMLLDLESHLVQSGEDHGNRELAALVSTRFEKERGEAEALRAERIRGVMDNEPPAVPPPLRESGTGESSVDPLFLSGSAASPDEPTRDYGPPRRGTAIRPILIIAALTSIPIAASLGIAFLPESESEVEPEIRREAGTSKPGVDDCSSPDKPLVELSGEIDGDATLACHKEYLLRFNVFVRDGATLTIEPGTTIKGDMETQGTLIVQPGGRLVARGTPDQPIVFTSDRPRATRAPGDWGGVLLLGRAPINLRNVDGKRISGSVEGLPAGVRFGGEDPEDDSGVLEYVRIEYSGIEIAPNNEINGLTLAGVERGTKVDHVQIRHTADDCFEFFGGSVDAKHLICQAPGDDAFDWDLGYHGRLQYIAYLGAEHAEREPGEHGIELDNEPNGSLADPRTSPRIFNMTLCGNPRGEVDPTFGMLVRRGGRLEVENSLVTGFDAGVDVRDEHSEIVLGHSAIYGEPMALVESPDGLHQQKDDDQGLDELATLLAPDRGIRSDDPGLGPCDSSAGHKPVRVLTEGATSPPDDGFFDPHAAFLGAFRDASDEWDVGAWVDW